MWHRETNRQLAIQRLPGRYVIMKLFLTMLLLTGWGSPLKTSLRLRLEEKQLEGMFVADRFEGRTAFHSN
jgi:hypothetical protein